MQVSQVSFGKIYRSEVQVKNVQTGEYEPMNFVEYENKEEDKKQLKKYTYECKGELTSKYRFSSEMDYSENIVNNFLAYCDTKKKIIEGKKVHFYGIEDKDGNIQCLCETEIRKNNCLNSKYAMSSKRKPLFITYIGVRPKNFYIHENRGYSRLGTNMVKEILKIAKKKRSGYVWLRSGNDAFWDKVPYAQHVEGLNALRVIDKDDYKACTQELDLMI